jgi:hypothetical protein
LMPAPSSQPADVPVVEQGAQFHWGSKPQEFRFHLHVASGDYFTILEGAFFAPRFHSTTGGGAGGRCSNCIWIAKRSLPIWAMIVVNPGSSGGSGNGNTLFLRLFIPPVIPLVPGKSKSPLRTRRKSSALRTRVRDLTSPREEAVMWCGQIQETKIPELDARLSPKHSESAGLRCPRDIESGLRTGALRSGAPRRAALISAPLAACISESVARDPGGDSSLGQFRSGRNPPPKRGAGMGPFRPHPPADRRTIRVRGAGPHQITPAEVPAPKVTRFDESVRNGTRAAFQRLLPAKYSR